MKKWFLIFALVITIQHEYVIDGHLFVDYTVNDDLYKQCTIDEFMENVGLQIEIDTNKKLGAAK